MIVQKKGKGYEMLSGHNRQNAAKLAGLTEIPAIVKTELTEEEAYVYVIETNVLQRSFSEGSENIPGKAGDKACDRKGLSSMEESQVWHLRKGNAF